MWQADGMSSTERDRARQVRTTEIVEAARRQLGEVGPAALSLRSVARELGIAPSAVYRYFAGRDAILTALVLEGYQRLGAAVVEADERRPRTDVLARWRGCWLAARDWAVAHPHEYALLYGSPVLGYDAPPETTGPAVLVVLRLARVVSDAQQLGLTTAPAEPVASSELGEELLADARRALDALATLGEELPGPVSPTVVLEVIAAWTTLFGAISFELFGHYTGSVAHHPEHLTRLADGHARRLGLPGA